MCMTLYITFALYLRVEINDFFGLNAQLFSFENNTGVHRKHSRHCRCYRVAVRVLCFLRGRQQCRDNLSRRDFDLIRPSERTISRAQCVLRAGFRASFVYTVAIGTESASGPGHRSYITRSAACCELNRRIVPTTCILLL